MFIGLIVGFVVLALFWWYRRTPKFPPGPRGFPIVGVIPLLSRNPERKFHQWSKTYGPIMSARMGNKDWVILNSYDVITEAMLHHGKQLSARPANYTMDKILSPGIRGLIFLSGHQWEIKRRFGESTFRSFGVGRNRFETQVQMEAENLIREIEENKNICNEWKKTFSKAVGNVICRFIFGKRFDYSDSSFLERTHATVSHPRDGVLINLAILMPWLTILPPIRASLNRMLKQGRKARLCDLEEIERHKESLNPMSPRDFIDAFLVKKLQEERGKGEDLNFSDEHLLAYVTDLFIAGMETSTNTIAWCILGLLHYPRYQKEIQSEIEAVIGNEKPSMDHRDSMPFTQAFIHEIHRFCTLTPLALPHCASEDVSIRGYDIPKGTQVMANIWSVHNDSANFVNPHEFTPKRFIDEDGNFIKCKHVIPFLVGPRRCLGEQLAHMEIFIFLTSILQKFSIQKGCSGPLPPLNKGVAGLTNSPMPFKVIYVRLE